MSVEEKLDQIILLLEKQTHALERLSMAMQTTNNHPNLQDVGAPVGGYSPNASDTAKLIEKARAEAMAKVKSAMANVGASNVG